MAISAKLHGIQLLRFIAALSVVIAHALPTPLDSSRVPLRPDFLGATGVVIFFIVSGFIIIHATRGRFATRGAPGDFLVKRVIRIVPIYWVATLVALLVALFGSGHLASCDPVRPAYVASSFLFLAAARCDGDVQPLLTQGWTLNYEVFFYVIFASCLMFRRLTGCLILGIGFALLIVTGQVMHQIGALAPDSLAYFYMDPIILLFVGGMAAALVHDRLERIGPSFLPAAAMVAGTILCLVLIDIAVPYSNDAGQPHELTWIAGSFVFILFAFLSPRPDSFAMPFLELLGDASYSIYLVHIFALTAVKKTWCILHLNGYPLLYVVAGSCFALLAGVLVHLWIERPLTVMLRARANMTRVPVEFRA